MGYNKDTYKDEKEFKTDLIAYMTEIGYWCTPIQSRTVPGIPDVYCVANGDSHWFECKREHVNLQLSTGSKPYVKIHFRVGQQSWAAKHYAKSNRTNPVRLWVAFDDCIAYMQLKRIYTDGKIPREDFKTFSFLPLS